MCGILCELRGAKSREMDVNKFNKMLDMSRERGYHANGFMVADDKDMAIYREPGYCLHIPDCPETRSARVILAHVRAASVGLNYDDNMTNHPHVMEDLVLVHNGTARTAVDMVEGFMEKGKVYSDSYAILTMIHELRAQGESTGEAMRKTFNNMKYQDSFSVILYDNTEKALYLARESDRPMTWYIQGDHLILASRHEYPREVFGPKMRFGMFSTDNYGDILTNEVYRIGLDDMRMRQVGRFNPTATTTTTPSGTNSNRGIGFMRGGD